MAATALAETNLNQKTQFTGTTFNDCTDELIVVEGSLHTTTRFSTSGDRVHQGVHSARSYSTPPRSCFTGAGPCRPRHSVCPRLRATDGFL